MNTITGTLHYKAPELYNSFNYSNKIDIWAIGVCIYCLLVGHLPFQSEKYFIILF